MEVDSVMLGQASCVRPKEGGQTGRQAAAGASVKQDENASADMRQSCV